VADLAEADNRRPLLYVRSMEGLGR